MRRGSGEATREAMLDAALTLLAQDGFEATSVQAITDMAGTTKGAFYHYFSTKDDILLALHARFVEIELTSLQAIVGQETSATERLGRIIEEFAANHDMYRREVAVFNRERQYLRRPSFEAVRKQRDQVEQIVAGVISEGVESGELKPLQSVRIAAFSILGLTAWIQQWYSPSGEMSARQVGRMYAGMLLDGMRSNAPKGAPSRDAQAGYDHDYLAVQPADVVDTVGG